VKALALGSVALVVFGFGVAVAGWEWLRRHADEVAA
jgi:hypothetical protein